MTTIEELKIGELPPALFEAIMSDIILYSIGFVHHKDTPYGRDYFLLGSGTLVKVGTTHAMLTAHHVIKVLPKTGRLGLLLSFSSKPYTVDIQGIEYIEIARGTKESDGPDIGAVILAPNIAASIEAKSKVFYNLETRRDILLNTPPHLRDGVWLVNGFINEKTTTIRGQDGYGLIKGFYNLSAVGSPDPAIVINCHDYFDFPTSPTCRSITPKSFEGMSGGGLWQVPIKRDENGEFCQKPPLLSGLVFYQQCDNEGAFSVKCHGRISIYLIAYNILNRVYY